MNNTEGRTISAIVRFFFFRRGGSLALVVLIFLAVLGCGLFGKSEPERQPLPSEAADTTANSTFSPVLLLLNMDGLGTTADLGMLRERIAEIMQERATNGVFKVGSNEIENTVFVDIDQKIPIGVLADIAVTINESGGRAYLPKANARDRAGPLPPRKPNPQTLIVRAGNTPDLTHALQILATLDADEWAFSPDFEITADTDTLKLRRIVKGSIEIAANGEYFLNKVLQPGFENDLDSVKIEQKTIDRSSIRDEALGLIGRDGDRPELTVVASEHAPSENLYAIFSALVGNDVRWRVIVRRTPQKPNRKQ